MSESQINAHAAGSFNEVEGAFTTTDCQQSGGCVLTKWWIPDAAPTQNSYRGLTMASVYDSGFNSALFMVLVQTRKVRFY